MSNINPKLQNIIDDFAKDSHLTSAQYKNLTDTVTASPELNERLNTNETSVSDDLKSIRQ